MLIWLNSRYARKLYAAFSIFFSVSTCISPIAQAFADTNEMSAAERSELFNQAKTYKDQNKALTNEIKSFRSQGTINYGNQSFPADKIPYYNTGQLPTGINHYHDGEDSPTTMDDLYQDGYNAKSSACSPVDKGDPGYQEYQFCLGKQAAAKHYDEAGTNGYLSQAQSMRAQAQQRNPYTTLGIDPNTLPDGPSSVCTQQTTSLPEYVTDLVCSEIKTQDIVIAEVPSTSSMTYTYPECIDGGELSDNRSTCNDTVYSCPEGGQLNGTTCTNEQPTIVTYSYTSPVCPTGYDLSANQDSCDQYVYSCPDGGTLNGTTCTKYDAADVHYTGPAKCVNTNLESAGYKSSKNTMSILCEDDEVKVTARGAGSDGGGIYEGDFYYSIDFATQYNQDTVIPVAGDWSGSQKQGALDITGGCNNGQCSYSFRLGRAGNAWTAASVTCPSGYSENGGGCSNTRFRYTEPLTATCSDVWVLETKPWKDNTDGAKALCGNVAGSIGSITTVMADFGTVEFSDPRTPEYSCPTGSTLEGTQCKTTYPATSTHYTTNPGCMGGYTYIDGTQTGGTKTCESTSYTCPPEYEQLDNQTCQINYPATEENTITQPGCFTGNPVTIDEAMFIRCEAMRGGTWINVGSVLIDGSQYFEGYTDIPVSCNFDESDEEQRFGIFESSGSRNLYVDRVYLPTSTLDHALSIEAEDGSAAPAVPVNPYSDLNAFNGMAHFVSAPTAKNNPTAWIRGTTEMGIDRFTNAPVTATFRLRTDSSTYYSIDPNSNMSVVASGPYDTDSVNQAEIMVNGANTITVTDQVGVALFDHELNVIESQSFSDASALGSYLNTVSDGTLVGLVTIGTYGDPMALIKTVGPSLLSFGIGQNTIDNLPNNGSFALLSVKNGRKFYTSYEPSNTDGVSSPEISVQEYVNGNSGVLCVSQSYVCPEGYITEGQRCTAPDEIKDKLESDPRCKYLDDPTGEQITYLCTSDQQNECTEPRAGCDTDSGGSGDCSPMNQGCELVSSECIEYDEIEQSDTFGQCLATEHHYKCPQPAQDVSSLSCNYQPMCWDGGCFDQETKCKPVEIENVSTINETCQKVILEGVVFCPAQPVYGYKNGVYQQVGVEPSGNCEYTTEPNCLMEDRQVDEDGNWVSEIGFACWSEQQNYCTDLEGDADCELSDQSCSIESELGTGNCLNEDYVYTCSRGLTLPTDECTQDFANAATAMEMTTKTGNYIDPNAFDASQVKIFSGEFSRCDRRKAAWGGIDFGTKNCCNIDSPDPKSNAQTFGSVITSTGSALVENAYSYGSAYAYDTMMQSDLFADSAMAAWQNGILTDQATMGVANWSPDLSVGYLGFAISTTPGASMAATSFSSAMTSGATKTFQLANVGSFNLTFTPADFYIAAAIMLFNLYQAALQCDETDYMTSVKKRGKLCYTTGTWCQHKDCGLFGCVCDKYRTGSCCFNSLLARIVNEQGRAQLGLDMKQCDGFTIDQMQQLDWSQIDLTEFMAEVLSNTQNHLPTDEDIEKMQEKLRQQAIDAAENDQQRKAATEY